MVVSRKLHKGLFHFARNVAIPPLFLVAAVSD